MFLDRPEAKRLCRTSVGTSPTGLPSAMQLTRGQWVITTRDTIDFTVLCEGSRVTRRDSIHSPLDILSVDEGCYASSSHLTLPAQLSNETDLGSLDFKFNVTKVLSVSCYPK